LGISASRELQVLRENQIKI